MSNSDFPWFPFYARDWLTDTKVASLSCSGRGAYIHLLCYQWENGGLPDSWDELSALTSFGDPLMLEDELADLFPVAGDGLRRNPRLMEILAKQLVKKTKQREAAAATNAKRIANRSLRASDKTDADAEKMEKRTTTSVRKRTGGPHYSKYFERSFWDKYPKRNNKRVGKKATARRFVKLDQMETGLLQIAVMNYARSKVARDNMAKDPERFLKDDYWRDWVDSAGDEEKIDERDRSRPYVVPERNLTPSVSPEDIKKELGVERLTDAYRSTPNTSGDPTKGGDAIEEG